MTETEIKDYQAYLSTLDNAELLILQYEVKRSKEPKKHQLITDAFSARLALRSKREEVAHWVIQLTDSYITLKDYPHPVRVVSAKVNSRGNAAIILVEGETHTRYLEYKGA